MQSVILWDRWFNERTMVIISDYDVIVTGDSEFSCRSYEMPTYNGPQESDRRYAKAREHGIVTTTKELSQNKLNIL